MTAFNQSTTRTDFLIIVQPVGVAQKMVWLAIQSASQKWSMPLKDWRMAMSRFIIEFGDRLDGHF